MPSNYRRHDYKRPSQYEYFVNDKVVECPICANKFNVDMPNFAKLSQKPSFTHKDQRVTYENFDILWYNIWACPFCNYADFYSTFPQISKETAEVLKAGDYKNVEKLSNRGDGHVDHLIKKYYLVLLCNSMGAKKPMTTAKIWLMLYWLYGDINDETNKKIAAHNALSAYEAIANRLDETGKMFAYTIIAELSAGLKLHEKAVAYYEKVLVHSKKLKALLYKQAGERLLELKSAAD